MISDKWLQKEELPAVDALNFRLEKNEAVVQSSSTAHMLWKIDELIAYISSYFTLKIGDIIFTGTPAGVGKVATDDRLTGYLENQQMFSIKVK